MNKLFSIRWLFPLILSVSLLLAPSLGAEDSKKKKKPPLVTVATVVKADRRPSFRVSATVEPLLETVIAARVDGLVLETRVAVGDRVAANQVLVDLEASEARHLLAIAEAEVAEAEARLRRAEADLRRDQHLSETDFVSKQRLADRIAEVAVRQALLKKTEAQRALARERLSWYRIRAPFAGVVAERPPRPGQWVDQGQALLRLIDPQRLEIKALIPAALAPVLTPGTTAEGFWRRGQADSSGTLTLRTLIPRGDPVSRNFAAYWRLAADIDTVKPLAGQAVSLHIPLPDGGAPLLVPKDALIRQGERIRAYVVEEETIRAVTLTLGAAVGENRQVLDGLRAGQRVVIRGNERVRPGQRVRTLSLEGKSPKKGGER